MSGGQSKKFLYTVTVLFFLSGVSGLVYQVLWLRLLSLVFGVTIYAVSAESIRVNDFESFLDCYTAGPEEVRNYVGTGFLLTDDRPMLEYFLSQTVDDRRANLEAVRGDVMRHVVQ